MKTLSISLILIVLLISSCSPKEKPEPEITYDGTTYVKIVATNVIDSFIVETNFFSFFPMKGNIRKNISISRNDKYFIQFQITKPELVKFTISNYESFKTYLIPNDTVTLILKQVSNDSNKISTIYAIDNDIFKYCKTKFNKLGYYRFTDDDTPFARTYLYKMGRSRENYNAAIKALDSEEKKSNYYLKEYENSLPKWFITLEKANIQYNAAYARLMMYNDLSSYKQTQKPPVSALFYNPSARVSTDYYSFLAEYFLSGHPSHFNFTGINRLVRIFDIEYPRIDSLLKGDIKNHFITGLIASYYPHCANENEVEQVDSLFISHDFKLTPEEMKFINNEKQTARNNRIALDNLSSGECAPPFELKDVNGTLYNLSNFRGKIIYLHFWATWCSPCLDELPTLNKLITGVNNNKIVFINVCLDNNYSKWRTIISEKKLLGINLICNDTWNKKLSSLYKISGIPHYALIDKKGLIIKNDCARPGNVTTEISRLLDKK